MKRIIANCLLGFGLVASSASAQTNTMELGGNLRWVTNQVPKVKESKEESYNRMVEGLLEDRRKEKVLNSTPMGKKSVQRAKELRAQIKACEEVHLKPVRELEAQYDAELERLVKEDAVYQQLRQQLAGTKNRTVEKRYLKFAQSKKAELEAEGLTIESETDLLIKVRDSKKYGATYQKLRGEYTKEMRLPITLEGKMRSRKYQVALEHLNDRRGEISSLRTKISEEKIQTDPEILDLQKLLEQELANQKKLSSN